jgi:ERCC4-type nuclease
MALKMFPDIEVKMLPVGDIVCLDNNVCIERKNVDDYASSVMGKKGKRGRIFSQVENMKHNFLHNFIIIVGSFDKVTFNPKLHFNLKQFLASQASLSTKRQGDDPEHDKIPVYHVQNNSQFFTLAKYLIEKTDGPKKKFNDIQRIKPKDGDLRKAALSWIPGVGETLAEAIVEHFDYKQLSEYCQLTEDELRQVPKIGKKKASMIKKWLN